MQALRLTQVAGAPPAAASRAQTRPRRTAPRPVCAAHGSPSAGAAASSSSKVHVIDAARARMYEATFAGVGAPEWNEAVCVSNREALPGVRVVTLEVRLRAAPAGSAALPGREAAPRSSRAHFRVSGG